MRIFSIAIRKRKSAHIKHHLNDLAHCLSNSLERPSIITEQKNYCNKNYGVQSPGHFVRLCSQTKTVFYMVFRCAPSYLTEPVSYVIFNIAHFQRSFNTHNDTIFIREVVVDKINNRWYNFDVATQMLPQFPLHIHRESLLVFAYGKATFPEKTVREIGRFFLIY